jgi:hypothetical protein
MFGANDVGIMYGLIFSIAMGKLATCCSSSHMHSKELLYHGAEPVKRPC